MNTNKRNFCFSKFVSIGVYSWLNLWLRRSHGRSRPRLDWSIWRELVTIPGRESAFGNEWKVAGGAQPPQFFPVIRRTAQPRSAVGGKNAESVRRIQQILTC